MMRLVACAAISLVAHVAMERGLDLLPPREDAPPPPRVVEIEVTPVPPHVEPPPPPVVETPPPRPPEAAPAAAAPPAPTPTPAPAPPRANHVAAVKPDLPLPDLPAVTGSPADEPVFDGGDLSSTSQGGTGSAGATGTGRGGAATTGSAATVAPVSGHGAAPIGAYDATKMPLPQGRCTGKYTPAATTAATEGTVVLDLTVGEDGRARDIVAISGLPNGLTESAIAALRDCEFSPGEKNGARVPVRIRGFKIKFVLAEATP